MPRPFAQPPRRVVVKVGSAVLAPGGRLEPDAVARLSADLGAALNADSDRRIVLVSSGAVASGFRALGLDRPPRAIAEKQAAAAVGQPRLMAEYAAAFAALRPARAVAQVLLTAEDIDHRVRFLNARHTLERLLVSGQVIPIINENDSVSFSEIKLGDNDRLSSLVATLVTADLLIILSSVPGVYASGSRRVIPELRSLDEALTHVSASSSDVGTGGMATKLAAACSAAAVGTPVVIASGAEPDIVQRLVRGEALGTFFPSAPRATAARKRWIGFSARPRGVLHIDEGARRALTTLGASLLPSGLRAVEGDFEIGELVEIRGPGNHPIARGLASYNAADLARLCGRKAGEIEPTLGYRYADEAVHRDDLVLFTRSPDR